MRKRAFRSQVFAKNIQYLKKNPRGSTEEGNWTGIFRRILDHSFNFKPISPSFIPLTSRAKCILTQEQYKSTKSRHSFSLKRVSDYENSLHKLKYALYRYRVMNEALHIRPQFLSEFYSWKQLLGYYTSRLKCILDYEGSLTTVLLPWIAPSLQKRYSILTIPCGRFYILYPRLSRLLVSLLPSFKYNQVNSHSLFWTPVQTKLVIYISLLLKKHFNHHSNITLKRYRNIVPKPSTINSSRIYSIQSWEDISGHSNLKSLLCSFYGLSSFGSDSLCVERLDRYYSLLKEEDTLVTSEISLLSDSTLRSMAHRRGIFPLLPIHTIKDRLLQWINSPYHNNLSLLYQFDRLSNDIRVHTKRST